VREYDAKLAQAEQEKELAKQYAAEQAAQAAVHKEIAEREQAARMAE
jgi:hypothetical protein